MQDNGFSIQFVSKVTNISAHTLRAWEKRYSAVVPARNEKGKRLYSQGDIKKLKLLTDLVQLGNSISDVASLDVDSLVALTEKYGTGYQEVITKNDVDISSVLKNLTMALRGFKLDIISHELQKVKTDLGQRDFSLRLLSPLLVEIGTMVYNEELSIAQEHAMSAIIKFHVGSMLYSELGSKAIKTKTVVLATPEGELHEFGIMISALLCSHYQLKFIYLGSNMPSDALSEAGNQIDADIVLVGVSSMFQTKNTEFLEEYFNSVREGLKLKSELWIGGMNHSSNSLMQDGITLVNDLMQLDRKLQALQ
jgi:DNA-binding transcriptional MerR regulator